mgnify:CR=1 FL=1
MLISYPLRNPLWPKEKDNAPLKWSHHQPKTRTLPKNKVKALNQVNKIKGKINLNMVVIHQVLPKVKLLPPSLFKIKSNLKIKNKLLPTLKMIKFPLLNSLLRRNWSVVPPRLHPSSLPRVIS